MTSRILIKIGGRAFEGEQGFKDLATAIKSTRNVEIIIVHGGGAEISQALKDANRKTQFIDGIRVTRAKDIKIVETVLSKTINQRIVSWLAANDVPCSPMSGKTRQLFIVAPLTRRGRDLGYVGKIKQVNGGVVLERLKAGQVPVVSPISANEKAKVTMSMPTVPQQHWPPLSGAPTLFLSRTFPAFWSMMKSGHSYPSKKRRH
jgi:acetylglutamate kinase